MSVTIYGRHDGDVVFSEGSDEDARRLPARLIHVLYRDAIYRGVDEITWLDEVYLTGSLEAIRRELNDPESKVLGPLDTCTFDGCEAAAPFNLRDTRPRCALHAKED